MIETTLAWPLALDANGFFLLSTSQVKIWNDRVAAVLGTRIGERAMRPTFGSGVSNLLFTDAHADTIDVVAQVNQAFKKWLPQLTLENVNVDGPNTDGVLSVSVDYRSPNNVPFSASVVVGTVGPDGTFYGVNK